MVQARSSGAEASYSKIRSLKSVMVGAATNEFTAIQAPRAPSEDMLILRPWHADRCSWFGSDKIQPLGSIAPCLLKVGYSLALCLVSQREGIVMNGNAELRLEHAMYLEGLPRRHVDWRHKPVRQIGADG